MLWSIQHRWAKMARFAFNCYPHEIRSTVCVPGGDSFIILSRGGVTQSNPLMMALYGVICPPLIEFLHRTYLNEPQPLYANDGAMNDKAWKVVRGMCRVLRTNGWLLSRSGEVVGHLPHSQQGRLLGRLR